MRERVAFVDRGVGGDQLFVCSHEPLTDPVGAVLIGSSVYGDFLANYQREVNLARALAQAGFGVVRFHYRGTGNSDGDREAVTLPSLQADARWAAGQVRSWLPDVPFALIGTRLGALAVAAAAQEHPDAPVVLCEPVTDLRRYYQDGLRSRAMASIATGKPRSSVNDMAEIVATEGHVDIVGNVIYPAFYESTADTDPVELISAAPARPALLMQFGGRDARPPLRGLRAQMVDRGWDVDTIVLDLQESWWFRNGRRLLTHPQLNSSVQTWLDARMVGVGAA